MISLLSIISLLVLTSSCEGNFVFENETSVSDTRIPTDVVADRVNKLLSHSLSKFALRLEEAISKTNKGGNVIFSPLSVASVLAMVLLGAKDLTADEITRVLGFSAALDLTGSIELVHEQLGALQSQLVDYGLEPNSTYFSIGNGMFVQEEIPVELDFIKRAIAYYGSDVKNVDFRTHAEAAKETINSWVADITRNHIKHFLSGPPSQETNLILASALYFNGDWEYPFSPADTTEQAFFIKHPNGTEEEIQVKMMMNNANVPYFNDNTKKCRVIGLPYRGNKMTMYLVMPDHDIKDLLNNLSVQDLENFVDSANVTQVMFFLPRMKLENTILLKYPLQDLGVGSLFEPDLANLNGISEGIFVSEAIHKVKIELTEKGTVASAATLTMVLRTTAPFVSFDRPFFFFIRHDESETIIFWGTVMNPNA